jgi:hypothetical protein
MREGSCLASEMSEGRGWNTGAGDTFETVELMEEARLSV